MLHNPFLLAGHVIVALVLKQCLTSSLAHLKLTKPMRLASNSWQSPCLWLLSTGIKGIHNYNSCNPCSWCIWFIDILLRALHQSRRALVCDLSLIPDIITQLEDQNNTTQNRQKCTLSLQCSKVSQRIRASYKAFYELSVILKSKAFHDQNFQVTIESFYLLCIYSALQNRCLEFILIMCALKVFPNHSRNNSNIIK